METIFSPIALCMVEFARGMARANEIMRPYGEFGYGYGVATGGVNDDDAADGGRRRCRCCLQALLRRAMTPEFRGGLEELASNATAERDAEAVSAVSSAARPVLIWSGGTICSRAPVEDG